MRLLSTLVLVAAATAQEPAKGDKAAVELVGQMAGDKGGTMSYTLKKGGKVVAEGKDLTALPAKAEIDAAAAAGPFELTLSAGDKGAVKVTRVGLVVSSGGKTTVAMWGGRGFDLNAKDPQGRVVKAVTFPLTPTAEKKKAGDKKDRGDKKQDKGGAEPRLPVAPSPTKK